MKIGILTFHNGYNFGAYLQAYALSEYLCSLGHDAVIINYKSFHHTMMEWWCLRSIRPNRLIGNIIKALKFEKCIRQMRLTKRVYSPRRLEELRFDVTVYGSDSVWNYSSSLIGFEPAYFGSFVETKRRVAYAASFGPDRYEHGYPDELPDYLKRYDAAGVRDRNTKEYYERLTGSAAELVLDPSFLYSFDEKSVAPRIKNYILVYALGMGEEKISSIIELAKRRGKKIVSVGYYNKWADCNILGISPFEWVGFIKHADFVVTSMYHGTLFSIQLRRPFFVYYDQYRQNKIEDFTQSVRLEDRASMSAVDLEAAWNEPINWERLESLLNDKLSTSKSFLQAQLEQNNV